MATILIVEDNERNMKGYATLEAVTGEEGVRVALEARPELVLMDIHLPGISGIEALQQLRANPATASIPVIAVTASVMASDRRRITDAGFDAYLSKPINLREFVDTVRRVIGEHGAAS